MTRIVTKSLGELTPADYNPRKISENALAGLSKSIERFGLVEPIIWNERTGNVVGGHQRLKVLQEKGVRKTKVVAVNLSRREEKSLNVTLNNPHIAGEFTPDLQNILEEFKVKTPDLLTALNLDKLIGNDLGLPADPSPGSPGQIFNNDDIAKEAFRHFREIGFPHYKPPLYFCMQEINKLASTDTENLTRTNSCTLIPDRWHPQRYLCCLP